MKYDLPAGAAWVLVVLASAVSNNLADEPALLPQPGVLVLRTGRVLQGNITQLGNRYVVATGKRDEVGVPAASVEMHCGTLREAYERKRDALPPNAGAAEHLALADWCLHYEQMSAAAEQLMAAQRLEPDRPENAVFERRLRTAARRPTAAPHAGPQVPRPSVSPRDLDQLVHSMPDGTLEQFIRVIQPLLLNRCARCHNAHSSSSFQLMRLSENYSLPRRFTQRNLHSVMSLVDKGQPDRSPLLLMARSVHGDCAEPVIGEKEGALLDRLSNWVHQATNTPRSVQPVVYHAPVSASPTSFQPAASGSSANREDTPSPPAGPTPPSDKPASDGSPPDTAPSTANRTGSSDPFDPAVFNQVHRRR